MNEQSKSLEVARQFVKEHLIECCDELLSWRLSGVLIDGCVREAAKMVEKVDKNYDLQIVEDIVTKEAMNFVVELKKVNK